MCKSEIFAQVIYLVLQGGEIFVLFNLFFEVIKSHFFIFKEISPYPTIFANVIKLTFERLVC